jgi:hypothetical protein
MGYLERFRRFVLALSGAHQQTLDLVPTERARFESLGWAILITSGIATISMWFALASAVGINGILALPVALLWGFVIMGIDRWLVTSMPIDDNRRWALAAPRVVLAILLGTLISTPLVLRVFQAEINAQMAKTQASNYNTYLQSQKNSQLTKQITTYSTELQYLNTIINSHGATTGNTAADPELVAYNKQLASLNTQFTTWTGLQSKYYQNYTCQLYGGPTCPKKGDGPAAKASKQNYDSATSEITTIKGQINHVAQEVQARDKQLNDNSASAQLDRYQEAVNQRPLIHSEYNTAVQQQNQLQQSFFDQNQAAHGILARLEALSQLSNGNLTVTAARILLFLLFLVIECLPVTVKLLQKPGQYEAALRRAKTAENREVEVFYSSYSGYGAQVGDRPAPMPSVQPRQAEPRKQADSRKAEPESPSSRPLGDVFGIWHQTKVMDRPVGDPADERGTDVLDGQERQDFPPSESDPRASHGWRQSRSAPQDDRDAVTEDPAEADADRDYDAGFSGGDAYQREFTPPQGSTYGRDDDAVHQALSQVEEEEPSPARPEGNGSGIVLNWDDE